MSANWPQVPLADACGLITDGTHHSPPNKASGDFKYVTAKNIRRWGLDLSDITYVDAATHEEIYKRCPVEKGDVLYIKDGVTTGLAAVNTLEEPFSMLSSVALLKPKRDVLSPRFLKHWLNSPETFASMTSQMTGSAIKRLVLKQIRSASIPLPPLAEQERIADKLDRLLAAIDTCKARLDAIPAILKRFRQSVLSAATSGELTEEWRERSETHEWQPSTLAQVCTSIVDGDHQAPPRADSGVPFLVISNVNAGRLNLDSVTRWVPQTYYDALGPGRRAERFDVLYTVTGTIGVPVVVNVDTPFTFQRHIALLKPDHSKIDHLFLWIVLGSEKVLAQVKSVATGTAQLTIPLRALREFEFLAPSLNEQREIAARVESLFAHADEFEAKVHSALSCVDRLTQSVLAKAFRGEIVPQDPSDEPVRAERTKDVPAAHSISGHTTVRVRRPRSSITIESSRPSLRGTRVMLKRSAVSERHLSALLARIGAHVEGARGVAADNSN